MNRLARLVHVTITITLFATSLVSSSIGATLPFLEGPIKFATADSATADSAATATTANPSTITDDISYGLLIDAGSSGSRIYPFYWSSIRLNQTQVAVYPLLDKEGKKQLEAKVTPGLSAQQPQNVAEYLRPLIQNATQFIPQSHHANTYIYLKATAGMRLVPRQQRQALIDAVAAFMSNKTEVPFKFDTKVGAQVIPGEHEGLFGWLAANSLLGRLLSKNEQTVATLDLGGASTQITFEPTVAPLEGAYASRVNGTTHDLYTHSYLMLGSDEARKRMVASLMDSKSQRLISDPCLFLGTTTSFDVNNRTVTLVGKGEFGRCRAILSQALLGRGNFCATDPCAINGVHQPDIPEKMPIYATGSYYYTAKLFGCDGTSTVGCLLRAAEDKCSHLSNTAAKQAFKNTPFLNNICFNAALSIALLHDSYRIPLDRTVEFSDSLPTGTLSWALGAMVNIANDIGLNIAERVSK
ncbi:nucleoside phosphatase GDA1/CD39 [Syncephalis fuscata]|nr:nucleoside phosphatase GDA1/CD39 [Syncephalis fuscata]